ncbi:MAG: helix-turn-helix domain-containing protein [Halobacteriales archaeon]|nr:helix-turn-helix domain-containing protein [Halobacteriales archaeon]
MSLIARYAAKSDELPLTPTFSQGSIRLVLERTVGVDPSRPAHFSWVTEGVETFEATVDVDPTVRNVTFLTESDERRLYRYELTDGSLTTYEQLVALGAQRLRVQYEDGWWHARTRFPDSEAFETYRSWLDDHDVSVRLLHTYTPDTMTEAGLTPEQRVVLELASERGYFTVPRETTAGELADELDISRQAVSERLRRGLARLTERYVGV